jgi:hypothetical protein
MVWVLIRILIQGELEDHFVLYMNSYMFWHIIYEFICYTKSYAIQIHITDEFIKRICFPVCVHSLMILLFYYNSSNTLMKLATGSKWRITSFENAAQRQLQTSSLSSKLSVCDDIVNECLYICNENFD